MRSQVWTQRLAYYYTKFDSPRAAWIRRVAVAATAAIKTRIATPASSALIRPENTMRAAPSAASAMSVATAAVLERRRDRGSAGPVFDDGGHGLFVRGLRAADRELSL